MIAALRQHFNQHYRPEQYTHLLQLLEQRTGAVPRFRVAETPCFFAAALLERCAAIGAELTHRLVDDPAYLQAALAAIPAGFRMPGLGKHPHFMTADFGLVAGEGGWEPKLVELQAFPSIYAYQTALCAAYREAYDLPAELKQYLGGHTEQSYWELLGRTILGGHQGTEVVLAEVLPDQQKTYPDFALTSTQLGVPIVDIAQLHLERTPCQDGARVFYRDARGVLQPVRRIYNRAIVDEIVARGIQLPFRYEEPLAVEWAGHPNWYFAISKFSLPFLKHPAVPPAFFLDDWLAGRLPDELRDLGRAEWILKPLFAFAGKGIEFGPTDEQLQSIAPDDRRNWLMQQRMHFAAPIQTPFGPTQVEVRILYLWPDGGELEPVFALTRLGRGKMIGVDHNRDQQWVGGSAAFYVS